MNKVKDAIALLGMSAGVLVGLGFNSSNAEAKSSGTTPTAIRGTFYRVNGGGKM